ncbi:MAG: hypothetical protein HKN68_11830 [Saprospiraceae bacterium]|nr:hypothetical protein [Saprospiraceae bacterium]
MKKLSYVSDLNTSFSDNHNSYILKCLLMLFTLAWGTEMLGQDVIIKDNEEQVLMQFNDEGSTGSITFFPSTIAPLDQVNKLYNFDGNLYWERVKIGTANEAAGWLFSSPNVFLKDKTHNVGIGTGSPLGKLHILQESTAFAFRVDDAKSDLTPFIIDDTGNVGVGTLSPTQKLEVVGKFKLGDDATTESEGVMRFNTTTDEFEGFNGTSWLSFGGGGKWLSSGSDIYFNTGNVGVGSASPLAKFYVIQKGTTDAFRVDDEDPDTTPFIIKADGKVGIGTDIPLSQLYVVGEVGIESNNAPILGFYDSSILGAPSILEGYLTIAYDKMYLENKMDEGIYFGTNDQSRMILDNLGNLGIGTLTPNAKTHIIQESNTIDAFRVDDDSSDSSPFIISASGNVGIGTEIPSEIFDLVKEPYNIKMAERKYDFFTRETDSIALAAYNTDVYAYLAYHLKDIDNILGVDFTTNYYYGIKVNSGTSGDVRYGIYASAPTEPSSYAGFFDGNTTVTGDLDVDGTLTKGSGSFKIDHPLNPENKYLYHSFVESPDMMNVYNGNTTTGPDGYATVELPSYFEALNKDFRYQLTVIGEFAQAIISKKIDNNQFEIRTDKPNIEVSWQVTGIRNDAYAQKNRIQVEVDKKPEDQGTYIHPEAFGKSEKLKEGYEMK